MSIELKYQGKAVSGKNQQRTAMVRGRVVKFPNKNFKTWRADFQHQVWAQLAARSPRLRAPVFIGAVSLRVDYYPGDRLRRDATGILDAIFHACEVKNGGHLVVDDAQFKVVRFAEHAVDKKDPRLLISIEDHVVPFIARAAVAAGCGQ